jgi:hypothetical protein
MREAEKTINGRRRLPVRFTTRDGAQYERRQSSQRAQSKLMFAIARIEIDAMAGADDIFFLTIDLGVTLVQHRTLHYVHFSLDFVFQ